VVDGVWPTLRVKAVVELDPYAGSADAPKRFPLVSASTSTWAIPWALLIVVLLAAAAGYLLVRKRRRPAPVLEPASEDRDEVLVS
jgi:LPXTG-motif cell wall-anchored protein